MGYAELGRNYIESLVSILKGWKGWDSYIVITWRRTERMSDIRLEVDLLPIRGSIPRRN